MNYDRELMELGDRFERLKSGLSRAKGALQQAVEHLKTEHGVDNAKDAEAAIDDLKGKLGEWEEERARLFLELRKTLDDADEEEDDFE
ncbi:MAG: hypothetical protein ACYTBJ_00855 [Planctomycetota bacterium]|jgi:hypothetical protein